MPDQIIVTPELVSQAVDILSVTARVVIAVISLVGVGFTAWAGVVFWAARRVTRQVDVIGQDVKALTVEVHETNKAAHSRLERMENKFRAVAYAIGGRREED